MFKIFNQEGTGHGFGRTDSEESGEETGRGFGSTEGGGGKE